MTATIGSNKECMIAEAEIATGRPSDRWRSTCRAPTLTLADQGQQPKSSQMKRAANNREGKRNTILCPERLPPPPP